MYWELEGNRTNKEDYVLLAKKTKTGDLIDTIATSAPVAAISDFNKSFFDLIVSSVGFVAALSWNDVIRTSFEKGGVMYKHVGKMGLLYVAIFVTILAYILTALVKSMYPERQIAKKTNPFEKSADETSRTK